MKNIDLEIILNISLQNSLLAIFRLLLNYREGFS